MEQIEALHARIRACTLCADAGYIERAAPVVAGRSGNRMMLIGQAPGVVEFEIRQPFRGRAGRELFRWMHGIGIPEDDFRSHVYMTSITKCFPGKASGGAGDRKPSRREVALCRTYLDAQLRLIHPNTILLVGGLAIERWFPGERLDELIGRRFVREGIAFVPLPHPSGASRWLNVPAHRKLLAAALDIVREEWDASLAEEPAHRGSAPVNSRVP